MPTTKKAADDLGAAELQKETDKVTDQGFVGKKVDPLPNTAHSLASGPDAPPVHDTPTKES